MILVTGFCESVSRILGSTVTSWLICVVGLAMSLSLIRSSGRPLDDSLPDSIGEVIIRFVATGSTAPMISVVPAPVPSVTTEVPHLRQNLEFAANSILQFVQIINQQPAKSKSN